MPIEKKTNRNLKHWMSQTLNLASVEGFAMKDFFFFKIVIERAITQYVKIASGRRSRVVCLLPGEATYKHLLIPDREPVAKLVAIRAKSSLVNQDVSLDCLLECG